jgi:excisionase family DNA binding protein
LWTKAEVADLARVSERTIQRQVARGLLKAVRVGRQLRFRDVDVDAWLSGG